MAYTQQYYKQSNPQFRGIAAREWNIPMPSEGEYFFKWN